MPDQLTPELKRRKSNMRKAHVRLINDFREPEDNEFFFDRDPRHDNSMRDMLEYLEANFGFTLEQIESWKIRTTAKSDESYESMKCGFRVVENK